MISDHTPMQFALSADPHESTCLYSHFSRRAFGVCPVQSRRGCFLDHSSSASLKLLCPRTSLYICLACEVTDASSDDPASGSRPLQSLHSPTNGVSSSLAHQARHIPCLIYLIMRSGIYPSLPLLPPSYSYPSRREQWISELANEWPLSLVLWSTLTLGSVYLANCPPRFIHQLERSYHVANKLRDRTTWLIPTNFGCAVQTSQTFSLSLIRANYPETPLSS